MLEPRRRSQRSPRYHSPAAGAAAPVCRGRPPGPARPASSQEKSPLNPVHQTTLPTSAARRSRTAGGSRRTGRSCSSGSAGGASRPRRWMSSSTVARTLAAKASPAARLAAALSSKPTRSPSTVTGRPARVAPTRASPGRLRPRPGAMIGMGAFIIAGSHRPLGELGRAAVLGGVELGHPAREPAGQGRDPGDVLVAGGHDHGAGPELAVVGGQRPAVARRRQPGDPDALADRAAGGDPLQALDDLAAGGVGVALLVAEHGVHPAGGVEPEGVPALGPPAPGDPVPLQHQVVDPATGQGHAGRQPGRPGADDGAVDRLHPGPHPRSNARRNDPRNASGWSTPRKWPASSITSRGQPYRMLASRAAIEPPRETPTRTGGAGQVRSSSSPSQASTRSAVDNPARSSRRSVTGAPASS